MAGVEPEAIAIATLTLTNQLISRLIAKGVLTQKEAESIYEEAMHANEQMATKINEQAAYLLQQSQGAPK